MIAIGPEQTGATIMDSWANASDLDQFPGQLRRWPMKKKPQRKLELAAGAGRVDLWNVEKELDLL